MDVVVAVEVNVVVNESISVDVKARARVGVVSTPLIRPTFPLN